MPVAACASYNPELWFSDDALDIQNAMDICRRCPLKEACDQAGATEEYGIWGGHKKGFATGWPQEAIDTLMRLKTEGKTFKVIAATIGVSRRAAELKYWKLSKTPAQAFAA